MLCPECGADNRSGRKFCLKCGTALQLGCSSCGATNEPSALFCGECGTSLAASGPSEARPEAPLPASQQERRLVSVLFADLVGFTTLSESRDSEEVRDLLTRYFDDCRSVITRYGGAVEKFIGDAVMAVWGTPVATENDAERAVRASLELIQAVAALGAEAGAPGLQARAGVVTGEAAVDLSARGQGMVAGDVVNTAARLQTAAAPGGTFVDGATYRLSAAAIAYEDAGVFELKGKAEPVQLFRALRVVANRMGMQRAEGLEAPFVGRDREMRLVKDLFHGCADEGRAHLVTVAGVAGIGKTRLSWELEKYIDGLSDDILWHRGRCLPYGEGVSYWALAEMVRRRADILEEEETAVAAPKLSAAVARYVSDPDERRWIEPRLASLLGLETRSGIEKEDLFSGWRLFFERLSEHAPTVLVFEDLQWADPSLLDFIEYLLEWSRRHSLFVLILARPELFEKRPSWSVARRDSTTAYLDPLPADAMDGLLSGLAPGLAQDLRTRIAERAEGIPLYAVETVRMLLDRGLLKRSGDRYEVSGAVDALEVPESLQALIAARLDALPDSERHVLQDAAVAGKTVTKSALLAVTGRTEDELDPLLTSLVRRELLAIQQDPMSPERGQYGFVQALVQKVAYETISKKDRKARHLEVADYLERGSGYDRDEIAEVVCSHLLHAYRAAPQAPDAAAIKRRAAVASERAGERAEALAAADEARRYYEQAAELQSENSARASLLERAGRMAWRGADSERAMGCLGAAVALYEREDMVPPAARVKAALAEVMWDGGRGDEALEGLERSFEVLSGEEPDADLAFVAHMLGRLTLLLGKPTAARYVERALEIAEAKGLPEVLSGALNTKGLLLLSKGRNVEGLALIRQALEVALENDLSASVLRAHANMAHVKLIADRYNDALAHYADGLTLARTLGYRYWERSFLLGPGFIHLVSGAWDEALALLEELPPYEELGNFTLGELPFFAVIAFYRGDHDTAKKILEACVRLELSDDLQDRASYAIVLAVMSAAEGCHDEALTITREALRTGHGIGIDNELMKACFAQAGEAALALDDRGALEELVAFADTDGRVLPPFFKAHAARFRARLAAMDQDDAAAEASFWWAAARFRDIGAHFYVAVTLLEHGEWLLSKGRKRDADDLIKQARATFEELGALPWLERIDSSAEAVGA
ncbi:MAG TPA: adenylate/guanylate cyclase domain-containing protein [Actinomycetota bacterium]|nr:adenylate/guanylate cyclase domain-containing protein [Actinomycetota bacterium]